jgi:hypothetical protein
LVIWDEAVVYGCGFWFDIGRICREVIDVDGGGIEGGSAL